MINETRYNEKSDIWAVGCLIYEMAALAPPFDAANQLALAVKINTGKFPRLPEKYSDELYRAVRWCLQLESSARPTVEELERLPGMRLHIREASLAVREYNLSASYSSKMRALKAREAAVAKRESDVAAREASLAARVSAARTVLAPVPAASMQQEPLPTKARLGQA